MPVKHDPSGRRSVEVEVEVPGTPEEVWQAIATGPGISSWFVPTELDERVGGTTVSHFGPDPDMASHATVTAWEPPHRFAEEGAGFTPDAPPLATEWIVESRSGGTCVVRVVHSFFTSSDNWDDQLEAIESGWPAFFRILRLSLTHFRGQPSTVFQVMGAAAEPKDEAWQALTGLLGLAGAVPGQRVASPAGPPPLAGLVEWASQPAWLEEVILRLDQPAPGLAHLYAQSMGEQTFLTIHIFLYGEQTAATALRAEPEWQSWLNARFPMPAAEMVD
jgi:uncharacterized protein YndB with AHSA1/START domain